MVLSEMHIPPPPKKKKNFQKVVGGVKIFFQWSFELNESDIKINAYRLAYMKTVSLYLEAIIFISDNGVLVLFCFLEIMFVLGHQDS